MTSPTRFPLSFPTSHSHFSWTHIKSKLLFFNLLDGRSQARPDVSLSFQPWANMSPCKWTTTSKRTSIGYTVRRKKVHTLSARLSYLHSMEDCQLPRPRKRPRFWRPESSTRYMSRLQRSSLSSRPSTNQKCPTCSRRFKMMSGF